MKVFVWYVHLGVTFDRQVTPLTAQSFDENERNRICKATALERD